MALLAMMVSESQPDVLKKFVKDQTPILYDGFNEAFLDLKSGRLMAPN